MVFLGIYRAIYDYVPQSDNELPLTDGDLLMVLEKSTDDDWWRAKKKAQGDDDVEPEGLIPNNYVEEVRIGAELHGIGDGEVGNEVSWMFWADDAGARR